MYADDLLLISLSISHLQRMIDLCISEFAKLGLSMNEKKTESIRIGSRYKKDCIVINGSVIPWVNELKYLGLHFYSGLNLNCNFQIAKQKNFVATNGIFGKMGLKASPQVLFTLINSYCVPILLFSLEAVNLRKSDILRLINAYDQCFHSL